MIFIGFVEAIFCFFLSLLRIREEAVEFVMLSEDHFFQNKMPIDVNVSVDSHMGLKKREARQQTNE